MVTIHKLWHFANYFDMDILHKKVFQICFLARNILFPPLKHFVSWAETKCFI